jgi:hypothetical protein
MKSFKTEDDHNSDFYIPEACSGTI